MKNITVSVEDETYRKARVKAAEQGTSVSALVKQFLSNLVSNESEFERLLRDERAIRQRISNFSAGERLPRDELYERRK
jgi:plasmid stability protein